MSQHTERDHVCSSPLPPSPIALYALTGDAPPLGTDEATLLSHDVALCLVEENERLLTRVATLAATADALRSERDGLKTQTAELTAVSKTLQREKEALASQLEAEKRLHSNVEVNLSTTKVELATAETRATNAEQVIEELRSELEELRARYNGPDSPELSCRSHCNRILYDARNVYSQAQAIIKELLRMRGEVASMGSSGTANSEVAAVIRSVTERCADSIRRLGEYQFTTPPDVGSAADVERGLMYTDALRTTTTAVALALEALLNCSTPFATVSGGAHGRPSISTPRTHSKSLLRYGN